MLLELLDRLPEFRVPPLVILDIGAMREGTDRYAPLLKRADVSIIGFEPQQEELRKLQAEAPPGHRYLPYILGKGGAGRFHRTRYPGCSSLYEPDPGIIDLFYGMKAGVPEGNFYVLETHAVQTQRLDDVRIDCTPDLIKIDVQGAELDVLEGGAATVSHALVVEAEVEFVSLYRDQPLFGGVHGFLRGRGFQFHKFIDVGGRAFEPVVRTGNPLLPISQILWADAVFVRDFSRLERYGDDDLIKAAVILDEVYRSYDLAAHLIGEYDRRRAAWLRSQYVAELERAPLSTMVVNLRATP
jgi:FkbM family methyltransferase